MSRRNSLSLVSSSSAPASPRREEWPSDEDPSLDGSPNSISSRLTTSIKATAPTLEQRLRELYDENVLAKIWRTASASTWQIPSGPPSAFPEYVPQDGTDAGKYTLREPEFWTCGFFPGTLYLLLERSIKYPQKTPLVSTPNNRAVLLEMCQVWAEAIRPMATRTDTHDIGFIIMPALRLDWELTHNTQSLSAIIQAAHSLASRYVPAAGAIRSWDLLIKKDITITDMATNLIVIIDSMCNLDLLFYASAHSKDSSLADIATTHAHTLLRTHLRPETALSSQPGGYRGQLYSTCHVANVDPVTGELKRRLTAQGFADGSTWARGQSWAILGYAQTYTWTKDPVFLEAACGLAEYFLLRLGEYTTPPWDFDAPDESDGTKTRDSSAAMIAANGMLLLAQALAAQQQHRLSKRFLDASMDLVKGTVEFSLAPETARFAGDELTSGVVDAGWHRFDSILKHGTANNNANARKRYSNHGLVYGDYYFVHFGNQLLQMGMV